MKKQFFSDSLVKEAEKTLGEKDIAKTSDRAVIVLAVNHFDEELASIRKSVNRAIVALWTTCGVIIFGLLLKLI
jgi:hypothetical protein